MEKNSSVSSTGKSSKVANKKSRKTAFRPWPAEDLEAAVSLPATLSTTSSTAATPKRKEIIRGRRLKTEYIDDISSDDDGAENDEIHMTGTSEEDVDEIVMRPPPKKATKKGAAAAAAAAKDDDLPTLRAPPNAKRPKIISTENNKSDEGGCSSEDNVYGTLQHYNFDSEFLNKLRSGSGVSAPGTGIQIEVFDKSLCPSTIVDVIQFTKPEKIKHQTWNLINNQFSKMASLINEMKGMTDGFAKNCEPADTQKFLETFGELNKATSTFCVNYIYIQAARGKMEKSEFLLRSLASTLTILPFPKMATMEQLLQQPLIEFQPAVNLPPPTYQITHGNKPKPILLCKMNGCFLTLLKLNTTGRYHDYQFCSNEVKEYITALIYHRYKTLNYPLYHNLNPSQKVGQFTTSTVQPYFSANRDSVLAWVSCYQFLFAPGTKPCFVVKYLVHAVWTQELHVDDDNDDDVVSKNNTPAVTDA